MSSKEAPRTMKKNLTATYDHDVDGYHVFKVDRGQGLTGTLCIPKDKPIPDTVTIRLRTKAEVSREGA